ncbi:MAG: leucyl aminopeptidase, partial [Gammaproteobacteria bacterium]
MKFSLSTKSVTEDNTHCLMVPVVSGKRLPAVTAALDRASGGSISAAIKAGDISTSHGKTLLLRSLPGIASERVLLVGCGKPDNLEPSQFVTILQAAGQAVKSLGCTNATCWLTTLKVTKRDQQWNLAMAVQTLSRSAYSFNELKST